MRIAINGMGRIGRLLFRKLLRHPEFEIVAVNDVMDHANLVYLLKHDSVYGNASCPMVFDKKIIADGIEIEALHEPDPKKLPWKKLNVDVVLESSGRFTTKELASQHMQAGAKKVLLSTTGSDDIP
jgi:glyceraldehyde 3-phosphate dehydrogenase